MVERIDCPICGEDNTEKINFQNCYRIICPVCKTYNIGDAFSIPSFTEREKVKLRYFYYTLSVKDERRFNPINKENKEEFLSQIIAPNSILEKMDYIIHYVYKRTEFFGDWIKSDHDNGYRLFFCRDIEEFEHILNHLKLLGYINFDYVDCNYLGGLLVAPFTRGITLTGAGLDYAKQLGSNINSTQCFVAMWFDDFTDVLYRKIEKAVTGDPDLEKDDENYGANFNVMKIDDKHHTNYIPAEIISEIKRSRFMIADLTGYRGGVYYEAGFAEGLGIPVILTCHKAWLDEQKDSEGNTIHNGVHFDLKQKSILFWTEETMSKFQRDLVARIGEVVGFNQ